MEEALGSLLEWTSNSGEFLGHWERCGRKRLGLDSSSFTRLLCELGEVTSPL
jgi:hypothetical protein